MNRWFFRIFGIHTFTATANLLNIWICMRLADFAHMASQMSGVSLLARRGTTQVMLGVSLRARVDTSQVGHNFSKNNNLYWFSGRQWWTDPEFGTRSGGRGTRSVELPPSEQRSPWQVHVCSDQRRGSGRDGGWTYGYWWVAPSIRAELFLPLYHFVSDI